MTYSAHLSGFPIQEEHRHLYVVYVEQNDALLATLDIVSDSEVDAIDQAKQVLANKELSHNA